MTCSFDVFFLESILNGILFAGLLALLSLGLNLVFGVIDVVWICYAELVMIGMYAVWFAHASLGLPLSAAAVFGLAVTVLGGVSLHLLVIRPLLSSAPINQLLATGGVLFLLQAAATLAFGVDFRNLGVHLGSATFGEMYFSWARIATFVVALATMFALRTFLRHTPLGLAILALSQDRGVMGLIGVDGRRLYVITSALGGGLIGIAGVLMALQYDVYPQIGMQFGPLTFMVCVLGGLGNLLGGLAAALVMALIITIGGSCFASEWGYAVAFLFFILMMFVRPQGILGARS